MSEAEIGFGAKVLRGDGGSPEIFNEISELMDVAPPESVRDSLEATHHGSPDGAKEYLYGLIDNGEVTLELNHIPGNSQQVGLRDDQKNKVMRNFQVVWPDSASTTVTFTGLVLSIGRAIPKEEKMTISVGLKVSGVLTWS